MLAALSPRRTLPTPEQIVGAIIELADDGFCRRSELAQRFPGTGAQDLRRALRRAVAQGLIIERRGPDGGFHLAVSSEGWDLHRSG
jgi:DNA-binding IscR family transcriptional regulator